MVVRELLDPKSIVVIGASNDVEKPGGKVLKNIIDGGFQGKLMALNPKESEVQGINCVKAPNELDNVELAVIAIAAKFVPQTVKILAEEKGTKAFIILSAGFSEVGEEGKKIEDEVVEIVNSVGGSLIGPNCIGMLTPTYKGVFAGPIPKLDSKGIDFVTGSGATAVFILEAAIPLGLSFASLYSVGNSAQMGVEEVLKYWDETFDPETSSKVKIMYMEKVDKPEMLLKHASSLIRKGCRIAAIKSGTTEAGSRAASSHTGALAGSDKAVDALFRKAGIVRCYSKEELVYTAGVFMHKKLEGKRVAVITHAGGPGVMLTDSLSKGDMEVPHIEGKAADELLGRLYHGSSVANPIDFIATGTAEQLGDILETVDNEIDNIDASVVIFGTTGLWDVTDVYKVLDEKMSSCKKPIFPVLPSPIQAKNELDYFLSLGRVNFPDEVVLGSTLAKVYHTAAPAEAAEDIEVDKATIRNIIENAENGYISPENVQELLDSAGIPRAAEKVVSTKVDAIDIAEEMGYPLVMKVVGPVHKSDVGGVALNITSVNAVTTHFDKMMRIDGATGVLFQPMLSGTELFVGANYEEGFGHQILFGMGGIFIEVLKDVSYGLAPIGTKEAMSMIQSIRSYDMIKGVRGQEGISEDKIADVITRLSALLTLAPEIKELDLNPLLGKGDQVIAVDARVRVEK